MRGQERTSIHLYTPEQLNKLGNAIVYLCEHIRPLYKTKLLKLIYILDEFSVKLHGVPMFNLEYKVWQAGPVCDDVFVELSEEPVLLKDYIRIVREANGTRIEELKKFSDDEFTPNDLALLADVAKRYEYTSAEELVKILHRQSTPWYRIAKENDLLEPFEQHKLTISDFTIDLVELLTGAPE
ncbi:MAG: SocA family protein, partial [Flavobacteriales bacterium]|nr:SocA family protein [Flavobacteriales bacterium]